MSTEYREPPWWRHQMETFSALLTFCEGNQPEQTVEQTVDTLVIWDAVRLIVTSL